MESAVENSSPESVTAAKAHDTRARRAVFISTFGVMVPILLAGLQLWNAPIMSATGALRVFGYVGLVTGALVVAIMANWTALRSMARARASAQEAEERYDFLRNRLTPLLTDGLEDLLQNRLLHLTREFSNSIPETGIRLYVFANVDGGYQVVASTIDHNHSVRRMELSHEEGVIGFAVGRGVPVIARSLQAKEDAGLVLSLSGEKMGVQPKMHLENLEKCDPHQKWILSHPVFDHNPVKPWTNEVLGALTIDIREEDGKDLFLDEAFQGEVRYLAAEIATYLKTLTTLWVGVA